MRLTRLTTRRLMVLVAVAAMFAFGAVMVRTARHRRGVAIRHAVIERMILMEAGPAIERERERAEHHAALKQTYQRAARYPWLPVPPDPPPTD